MDEVGEQEPMTERRIRHESEMSITPPNLCGVCGERSVVSHTWTVKKEVRRRRYCKSCRLSWATVERRAK